MAVIGINTGSGYNGYTGGGGIGALSRENINRTDGNIESGVKSSGEAGKSGSIEKAPLENQVAVSKDGDTLQISPMAAAKLDAAINEAQSKENSDEDGLNEIGNGSEAARPEIKAEKAENARKEAKLKAERRAEILKEIAQAEQKKEVKTEEKQSISFAGKSDSDITRLYLEGEITKSDYDSEMSDREKLRAQVSKTENDFVNTASEADSRGKKIERFEGSLKAAFSDTASKTFDALTRLDTIDAAEGAKNSDKEKDKLSRQEVKFSYK